MDPSKCSHNKLWIFPINTQPVIWNSLLIVDKTFEKDAMKCSAGVGDEIGTHIHKDDRHLKLSWGNHFILAHSCYEELCSHMIRTICNYDFDLMTLPPCFPILPQSTYKTICIYEHLETSSKKNTGIQIWHYSRLSSSTSSPNARSVTLEPFLSFRSSLAATSPLNFATLLIREIPSSSKSYVSSKYAYLEIKT